MKIAVMATGGVGGYFGARLAQSGHEVHFLARGKHLEAMRSAGLRIQSPLGDAHLEPVRASADPAEIGPVDLVLFAVKLWDTEGAAQAIAPLVGRDTAVVSLQNGVEKDLVLARGVGREHLLGGLCYIASSIAAPGVIVHSGNLQRVIFGELGGARTARAETFLEAFQKAGITTELSPDIERETWEKFVFLVGLSATTSLVRMPIGPIREDPDARALLLDVMSEVVAVGRAKGVDLAPDYAQKRLEFCLTIPPGMTSSMQNDLSRGNRLELEWLSGAVVRYGAELGIDTPANRCAYRALKLHANGAPEGKA